MLQVFNKQSGKGLFKEIVRVFAMTLWGANFGPICTIINGKIMCTPMLDKSLKSLNVFIRHFLTKVSHKVCTNHTNGNYQDGWLRMHAKVEKSHSNWKYCNTLKWSRTFSLGFDIFTISESVPCRICVH